jgi:hypothetical protein
MEITMTELVLFVWAALATGYALKFHADHITSKRFAIAMLENPEMYAEISKSLDTYKRSTQNV